MKASEIRRQFLDYFVERAHREVPSAPVFPQDDPTLLFTNAGMNQFKDVFLGTGSRDYTRAVDTQKCIRVSGKHNDLEEVGVDTYHHTFFEMLGNWSFGDYFKEEVIVWAWELLTEVWKLPKNRLWVTVFGGDAKDGLPADEEAERIWREKTDVLPDHVLRFDRRDNFWEMGETGPCGPCSEIHIDRGGAASNPADGADPKLGVNAGNERFIELWNLVFMEFNRLDDGSLVALPDKHVDTGMGFERIVSVLQKKSSNYETDVFTPIFEAIAAAVGRPYGGGDSEADIAFRVIADHMRALSSAFADGALPSNVGRGYVLRRLLRRASRYGRQALGQEEPFLARIVPAVGAALGEAFPEIPRRLEHIQVLIQAEEEAFGKTLGRGLLRFSELAERVGAAQETRLPGDEAYELYATYGFPQDLVELMARERGLGLDLDGWEKARAEHRAASRSEGQFKQLLSAEKVTGLAATRSTYYEDGDAGRVQETKLLRFLAGPEGEGRDAVVLEASPFYAEGGGQVGDAGVIEAQDGTFRLRVDDTQRMGEVIVHVGAAEGTPQEGQSVRAEVDAERRASIRRNHTATHLLHKALRLVLGEHVTQQGSYVGPDRLRFDLSHPKAIDPEHVEQIEREVNARVVANAALATTVEELEDAKARGVMALFGEKYDERVRVVSVGDSVELCGGTHVSAAGDIGSFVIVSEGAIQAGVRRIEALTGEAAVQHLQHERRLLRETARRLKSSTEEIPARVEQLMKQVKDAKKKAAASAKADVGTAFDAVKEGVHEQDGVSVGALALELGQDGLRELSTRVKGAFPDAAILLLGREGERVPWVAICQGSAQERGWSARAAAATLRTHLGGGGGGKPDFAQGQGQKVSGVRAVLAAFGPEPSGLFQG